MRAASAFSYHFIMMMRIISQALLIVSNGMIRRRRKAGMKRKSATSISAHAIISNRPRYRRRITRSRLHRDHANETSRPRVKAIFSGVDLLKAAYVAFDKRRCETDWPRCRQAHRYMPRMKCAERESGVLMVRLPSWALSVTRGRRLAIGGNEAKPLP